MAEEVHRPHMPHILIHNTWQVASRRWALRQILSETTHRRCQWWHLIVFVNSNPSLKHAFCLGGSPEKPRGEWSLTDIECLTFGKIVRTRPEDQTYFAFTVYNRVEHAKWELSMPEEEGAAKWVQAFTQLSGMAIGITPQRSPRSPPPSPSKRPRRNTETKNLRRQVPKP